MLLDSTPKSSFLLFAAKQQFCRGLHLPSPTPLHQETSEMKPRPEVVAVGLSGSFIFPRPRWSCHRCGSSSAKKKEEIWWVENLKTKRMIEGSMDQRNQSEVNERNSAVHVLPQEAGSSASAVGCSSSSWTRKEIDSLRQGSSQQ